MHPDGLARAKLLRIPGACLFCEEPLPPARDRMGRNKYATCPSMVCGSKDCARAYYRAWKRDANEQARLLP